MWKPADDVVLQNVYFAETTCEGGELVEICAFSGAENICTPPNVLPGRSYVWRVDTTNSAGDLLTGEEWEFTVWSGSVIVTHEATDDSNTYVASSKLDTVGSNGAVHTIKADQREALVRFEMSNHKPELWASFGYPLTVASANLHIYVRSQSVEIDELILDGLVDADWDESSVTANSAPARGSFTSSVSPAEPDTWYSFDILAHLDNVGFDNTASSFPISFVFSSSSSDGGQQLQAATYASGTSSKGAYVEVEYVMEPVACALVSEQLLQANTHLRGGH
jgi:hypothetical protein